MNQHENTFNNLGYEIYLLLFFELSILLIAKLYLHTLTFVGLIKPELLVKKNFPHSVILILKSANKIRKSKKMRFRNKKWCEYATALNEKQVFSCYNPKNYTLFNRAQIIIKFSFPKIIFLKITIVMTDLFHANVAGNLNWLILYLLILK